MIQRTIHHFEDEPELVRWIPSALLNRYWSEHPDWIIEEGHYEEDDEQLVTTFRLAPKGMPIEIAYRLYRTIADFETGFSIHAGHNDLALIDLMGSAMEPVGLQAYRGAVEVLGNDNVFFLTAFPRDLATVTGRAHVITKPPDASQLVTLLVDKLQLGAS